jgi:Plavaka transposase
MKRGVNLLCPDSQRRLCVPVLSQYIADYEEQRSLACIKSGWCPKCTLPSYYSKDANEARKNATITTNAGRNRQRPHQSNAFAEDGGHPLRNREETSRLREEYKDDRDRLPQGLLPTSPFTEKHPHSWICECMAPDLLHQVTKCFYDYVHQWNLEIIAAQKDPNFTKLTAKQRADSPSLTAAKGEFDARFSHVPPYPFLRQFRKGVSVTSRWTGNEFRAMLKVYAGVAKGLIPDDASKLVKSYLDIHRLSYYVSHTEETLKMLDDAITEFWRLLLDPMGSFVQFEVVKPGWHCPKLHYFRHYASWVRRNGVLPFCSTDRSETWHKPLKASWRASNKGPQGIEFILNDEGRKLAWAMWEDHMLKDLVHVVDYKEANPDEDEESNDVVSEEGSREGDGTTKMMDSERLEIRNALRDNHSLVKVVGGRTAKFTRDGERWKGEAEAKSVQIAFEHLKELNREVARFIQWSRQGRCNGHKRKNPHENEENYYLQSHVSVHIEYPSVHDEHKIISETIRCQDNWAYGQDQRWKKSRYDTVLLDYRPPVENACAMDHRRIARVLLFFSMKDGEKTYDLAYVHMFRQLGKEPDSITGMYRIKRGDQYEVVEIDMIERGVHLIPCFKKEYKMPMANGSSKPALEIYDEFWVNNQVDMHIYNTIY